MEKLQYQRHNDTHIIVYNDSDLPDFYQNNSNLTDFDEAMVPEFKIFSFILYTLIFLLGMVGNTLFCYVVLSSVNSTMSSVTYRLLVNLSVSDLLITCLCGPVHVVYSIIMGFWPFGEVVCYAYSYLQGIVIFVSSYTLVIISFERYMSILYPLRSVIRRGYTRYIIVALWTTSALASIPNAIQVKYMNVAPKDQTEMWVCTTEMNDEFHYYSLALCIFQYFLPVLLMTYSYLMVATTIWKQKGTIESQYSHNSKNTRETNMQHGRKKMIKMLIVVVVTYSVCWLPFNIYFVIGLAKPDIYQQPSFPYIFTLIQIMAVSHTCCNPFIYCWMNLRIRHGFMEVLGNCPLVKKCCFWINWDANSSGLQRSATVASQYQYEQQNHIQRNRLTINGTSRMHSVEMVPLQTDTIIGDCTGSNNEKTTTKEGTQNFRQVSINEEVTAIDVENAHCGTLAASRLPKLSTVSNNMEMANLLSQEPLMAATSLRKQLPRSQKMSVGSNVSELTEISVLEDMENITRSQSSCHRRSVIQRRMSTTPMQPLPEKDDTDSINSSTDTLETASAGHVEQNEEKAVLTRSISEEINEQLMKELAKPPMAKSDDRYN